MKKNLVAGFLVAVLALAGVACSSGGGGTSGASEGAGAASEATS
jgi:hypothetical protein